MFGDLLRNDILSSIYVGGGTPNLMRDEDYARMLAIAGKLYASVPEGIEKTLEGNPPAYR